MDNGDEFAGEFTEQRDVPEDGNGRGGKDGMPFMLTNAQKAKLRALGYSDPLIRTMKPEEWHNILAGNLRCADVDWATIENSGAPMDAIWVIVESFEYRHRDGTLSFVVDRIEFQRPNGSFATEDGKHRKTFIHKRPDPNRRGQWIKIKNTKDCPVLPYQLQKLIEAVSAGHVIYVVEGEGKVNLCWSWKVPATCNAGGSGNWTKAHAEYLRDADVVIIGDNDDAGRKHVRVVGTSLKGVAKSVRVLDLPGLGPKEDIIDWAKRGGTVEALHELTEREAKPFEEAPLTDLRSYFIEELARKPLKPVEWLVEDFIPANTLTGFFGDGGTGKDRMLMLLAAAVACDQYWLGKKVKHGRALYFNVEDDDDELNRRQAAIAEHYDLNFENFSKRLKIVPLVGKDTVLAVFDSRAGVVKPTPLFESVRQEVAAFKPTLVIIGNRVNIFSVDQNSDTQARQCLGLLFGLCTEFVGTTVIMPGHVSLEGMRSNRGDSGTVQWSNGCRARLLLDRVTKGSGEPDQDARVLQVKKANWGPDKNEIKLRWSNGLFVPDTDIRPEKTWSAGEVAALLNDEDEFLRMLDLKPPVKVSHHPRAQNNAAKIFAEDSRCKLTGKGVRNRLKTAMERLFSRGVIEVVETGSPSRLTSCIRRVERGVIVDFPSGRPAPSAPASEQPQGNGGEPDTVASVPFMLTAAQKRELHDVLGYSDEQIREMTPQQGQDIIAQRNKLAAVLAAWSTTIGPGQPHTVEQVIAAAEMAGTSDDEASDEFKRALAAVAPQGNGVALEQWLRENSGIEVNQLMLREADTDKDGRSQWMLELRVEPDRGGGAD